MVNWPIKIKLSRLGVKFSKLTRMPKRTDNFSKFITQKKNSAIKESIKQEKKKEKKDRQEAIEKRFAEKRLQKMAMLEAKGKITRGEAPGNKPPALAKASVGGANNKQQTAKGAMPLNKYIAHCGIVARREAANLVKEGKVTVNGKPIIEPGFKVADTDIVKVAGKKITPNRNLVYILLNKPKDYITTTDDPQGRRTVLDLIRYATTERVYPIGRLDRNTSGVLLLTNDGELAQKLSHPKHEVKKIYHVVLDKDLTKKDFDKIVAGVKLEDGLAKVDAIAFTDSKDKTQVGLEIHSGRNRIVRRIFEHLNYDVRGLDRVMYAGLTKKNVQRGKWRLLSEKEVRILKFMNKSYT